MIVLVCGGRDFNDREALHTVLDAIHGGTPITTLVHGAARGADTLGAQWALANGVFRAGYPTDWDQYGKGAGFIRNQHMIDQGTPDVAVVCKGGRSTAEMVRRLQKAGIPIIKVGW